jgi:hypothetical protein
MQPRRPPPTPHHKLTAVSTAPGDLPPPPSPNTPTQIAGQEVAPTNMVPPAPAYAPAASAPLNTEALASFVLGIVSFVAHVPIPVIGGFVVAVIAVITGYQARQTIRRTGERGMGFATAGMIIGIVHLALLIVFVIVTIFVIFAFGIVIFGFHR